MSSYSFGSMSKNKSIEPISPNEVVSKMENIKIPDIIFAKINSKIKKIGRKLMILRFRICILCMLYIYMDVAC